MRAKAPCLNCSDRKVGCHSTCKGYKDFQESRQAENHAKKDFLKSHNEYVGYMKEQKHKRERYNRKG